MAARTLFKNDQPLQVQAEFQNVSVSLYSWWLDANSVSVVWDYKAE